LCFFVSSLYYGVGGAWYWLEFNDGWFLSAKWKDEIEHIIPIYFYVFLYVYCMSIILNYFILKGEKSKYSDENNNYSNFLFPLVVIGTLSSIYVIVKGLGANSKDEFINDPFSLIFYQFADVLIACILYYFTICKKKNIFYIILAVFLAYCIFTGLRYKIALMCGSLILFYIYSARLNLKKVLFLTCSVATILTIFSVLTVTRNKFSGVNTSEIAYLDMDKLMYGFFAETNSLYGFASAFFTYDERLPYVGMTPIIEVFEQFIPRFLYPDKNLYTHLKDIAYSISYSKESEMSGTTVPFFGEYYVMAGWPGILIGCLVYTFLVFFLMKLVIKFSKNFKQNLIGVSLVSIYCGYFYYSRGSVSLISKGIIFIILPYILLVWSHGKKFLISK
ncbi:MAG: O-antigen polysaccharide polymerase Wzy, partial [Alteromonadaceae bacterium TMED7]